MKLIRLGMLLLVTQILVAACSKNPAPVPESPNGDRQLLVWHVEPTQGSQDVLNQIAQRLEAENDGVSVVVELMPWTTLGADLATAIGEGRPPDLAMVEPYMMASLVSQDLLEPLDDLYDAIGKEDFYPFLREMNRFNDHYYGVPHAFGVGYYAVRRDYMQRLELRDPASWADFDALLGSLSTIENPPAQLCGGTGFLLDQMFVSLVASNGGQLFDHQTNRPLLTSVEVLEALEFFDKIASYSPVDWRTTTYQDTFVAFARGDAAIVPVTAARTLNQIALDAPPAIANSSHFGFFHTPVGPSGSEGFTFLDAEPWVLFSASDTKDLAEEFLLHFYSDETYLEFANTVPIHLSPARSSLSDQYAESDFISSWRDWYDFQVELIQSGRALPLLSSSRLDQQLPFLWEVFQSRAITRMLGDSGDPAERARRAQTEIEAIIEALGYRGW